MYWLLTNSFNDIHPKVIIIFDEKNKLKETHEKLLAIFNSLENKERSNSDKLYDKHNADFYNFLTIQMPDWKQRKNQLGKEVVNFL